MQSIVCLWLLSHGASQVAHHLPMQEARNTPVRSLGGRIPGEGKAAHSSTLAWRESHGQRSLVGYSPWGRKESDTTEGLSTQPCFPTAIGLAVRTETSNVKVLPLWPLMKKSVSPRPGGLTSSLQNHKVSRIAGSPGWGGLLDSRGLWLAH